VQLLRHRGRRKAAWSYEDAWPEVRHIAGLVSFEPDKIEVHLDGTRLRLEPGQTVIPHGTDRNLTLDEAPQQAAMTGIAAHGTTDLAAERLDWAPVLLSVNLGKPKDVPWQGKTVHTGAWKHPVAGPAMARPEHRRRPTGRPRRSWR
jgi:hypothetical protein